MCINQDEDEEKSYQVGLMSELYSTTECALCWLGDGTASSAAAVTLIKRTAELATQLGFRSIPENGYSLYTSINAAMAESLREC